MNNIQAIKIGNTVNISLNGKLHKKNCGNSKEAAELFQLALKAKENPTDENIMKVKTYLNNKLRVTLFEGLEADVENGEVFIAGFNTPIPQILLDVIMEYHENNYPMHPILNFWKLLMINPDKRVRESLFKFVTTHDFVLTDNGYMVVYKAVYIKKDEVLNSDYHHFIIEKHKQIRNKWKKKPNDYIVFQKGDGEYQVTKIEFALAWELIDGEDVKVFGNLGELHDVINNHVLATKNKPTMYTDMHTKKMKIELGKPVYMDRRECDSDPEIDCSSGLHVGATKYVEWFAGDGSKVLVCLVNPANVVAVPKYDHSKMRVSEYFPFALAEYDDGQIDIIEEPYFENDYLNFETSQIENQIQMVKDGELPFETAIHAEEEERPMEELMKMLENRLVDVK